jgi:uncharacterized membrane protein
MTRWKLHRLFSRKTLSEIEQLITASEAVHSGEIRFVIEGALSFESLLKDQRAKERALDVFSELRIWDTEYNNGLLIYLLIADRAVEIVADRGINAKVSTSQWELICRDMELYFKCTDFRGGAINGIDAVTAHLSKHFSARLNSKNELADAPTVLI